jgi:predicted adenylyl cyclase CyaB
MKNLEIKGAIDNRNEFEELVKLANCKFEAVLNQKDTYFQVKDGRLKIREISDNTGELIYYKRNEDENQRWSLWEFYPLDAPEKMVSILKNALEIRDIVSKERTLYIYKNARIHLDKVENLGDFFEIESKAVEGNEQEASETLDYLITKLKIENKRLIKCSYIDMIESIKIMKFFH